MLLVVLQDGPYFLQYDFEIIHRPGKMHGNADSLSRRPYDTRECNSIRKEEPQVAKVRELRRRDFDLSEIIEYLENDILPIYDSAVGKLLLVSDGFYIGRDGLLYDLGSDHQDFVVNFKGETISLKNLTKLLRHHNVTLPQEDRYLAEALRQKNASEQSCGGRCLSEERGEGNKCFCDKACRELGDCCLDFYSRCDLRPRGLLTSEATPRQNVTCGDVNEPLWFGVIMKSSCGLSGNPVGKDCKAAEKLNMTVQSELPVVGWKHNVTYRNIACARCSSEENVAFWDLQVKCVGEKLNSSGSDINEVRTFVLEKGNRCSWKYETSSYQERHCVLHDIVCAANKQPWMSVIKELCSSYSMPFEVYYQKAKVSYRNPHCALCDPEGHPEPVTPEGPGLPPWSIILDVSGNFRNPKTPNIPQPTGETTQNFNVTAEMLHCISNSSDCTITVGGKTCKAFISGKNQSEQMNASLDKYPGASLAANSSKASLILICIKLTTVMGLTWVLGLVANWKQTEFLHYPSTLMNSMQGAFSGFFIALCFTTSKRFAAQGVDIVRKSSMFITYESRYFEVDILTSATSTKVIESLEKIFCTHELPPSLKTDNGTQFVSDEFERFLETNDIEHRTSTPHWPQANGETRSKIPEMGNTRYSDSEARDKDAEMKQERTDYAEGKKRARESELEPVDVVLLKQKKENKLSTTYGALPHTVSKKH
ncbi:Uncharacterized protein K02A2.6, partial [Stylophora pistillata]